MFGQFPGANDGSEIDVQLGKSGNRRVRLVDMVGSEGWLYAGLMIFVAIVVMTGGCCFRLDTGGGALGGCAQENECNEQGR